ncbi:MAG: N-acetyltransferase [Caulobacteraceae bacterium]|nr:N-acetyltransferase [Caulobacteraceae bacterium]
MPAGPWEEYATTTDSGPKPWEEYAAPKRSVAPLPNVVAPTVKPTSTPAQDFNRALRMPGVTSAEKTTWEKVKDFATTPTFDNVALEGGAPNIGSLEVGGGSWKTEPVKRRVKDYLAETGGSAIEGAARGVGNLINSNINPLNAAMATGIGMAPKLVQAGIGAAFTGEQLMTLPEQVKGVRDVFSDENTTSGDKAQAVTELLGTTALGVLGAKGAVRDFRTSPQVQARMRPRILGDMDAAMDIGYGLGENRRTRQQGREMVNEAAEGSQARMNRFELPKTLMPTQEGVTAPATPRPPFAEQVAEGNDRTAKLLENYDKVAKVVEAPMELPPAPEVAPVQPVGDYRPNTDNLGSRYLEKHSGYGNTWHVIDGNSEQVSSLGRPDGIEIFRTRPWTPKEEPVASPSPGNYYAAFRDQSGELKVVGTIKMDSPYRGNMDGGILHLAVRPEFQRTGIGSSLIKQAAKDGYAIKPTQGDLLSADGSRAINRVNSELRQASGDAHEVAPPAPVAERAVEAPQPPTTEPPPSPNLPDSQIVRNAMRGASGRVGEAVLVEDVRAASGLPKDRFDAAMLEASRNGDIVLHEHDAPSLLDDYKRDQMVTDGDGRTYIGVSWSTDKGVPGSAAPQAPQPKPAAPAPADPLAQRAAARAKIARTLGMDPDTLSPQDNAIIDGMSSQDPKARREARAKYNRRSSEAGSWKPFANPGRPLTPSELHVSEQVAKREAARRAMQASKPSLLQLYWHGLRPDLVDAIAPMEDVHREIIKGDNDTYSIRPSMEFDRAVANVYRANSRAGVFAKKTGLTKAIQNLPTQMDVEGFDRLLLARRAAEIDRTNAQNAADLAAAKTSYAAAKQSGSKTAAERAMKEIARLEERGQIELGREPDEILKDDALIAEFTPKYQQHLDAVKNHVTALEDMMVQSGIKSQAEIDNLRKMYPDYADLHRIMPEGVEPFQNTRATASKSSTNVIQKLKGSDKLAIDSPLENLLKKTNQVIREAAQNEAARTAAQYGDLPGGDKFIRRISAKTAEKMKPEQYFTYLENGNAQHVAAPVEYVRAAKSLDAQGMGLLQQILGGAVRAFKVGTTGINPIFALYNFTRDQATRHLNQISVDRMAEKANPGSKSIAGKIGDLTGIHMDIAKATLQAIRDVGDNYVSARNGMYDEMVWNGGGGNSFDLYREQPLLGVRDIRAQKYNTLGNVFRDESTLPNQSVARTHRFESGTSRVTNALRGGWRDVENFIGMTEDMTRMQAYRIAKAEAIKRGMGEQDAAATAAKASRQATGDFYRGGNYKRGLMVLFPYANAGIQGTRSSISAMRKDPVGFATRAAMTVAIPVAIATLHNISTPEKRKAWEDIEPWEKDKSLIWLPENPKKNSRGTYDAIKLPMAPGISDVGTLVRRNIEAQYGGDPVKAQEYLAAVYNYLNPISGTGEQMAGQFVPMTAKPAVEVSVNKNFFTNRDIVPQRMLSLPTSEQRFDSTSGTAQMIGDAIGAAPLKVDHMIKGHLGTVAPQVLNVVDRARKGVADAIPGNNAVLDYLRKVPVGGESTAQAFGRRALQARGGATDEREMAAIDEASQTIAKEKAPNMRMARELFNAWKDDRVEGERRMIEALDNGTMSEETEDYIAKMVQGEQSGLSKSDRYLLHKSADERAEYFLGLIKGKSEDEAVAILEPFQEKKILTDKVLEAIAERRAKQK